MRLSSLKIEIHVYQVLVPRESKCIKVSRISSANILQSNYHPSKGELFQIIQSAYVHINYNSFPNNTFIYCKSSSFAPT